MQVRKRVGDGLSKLRILWGYHGIPYAYESRGLLALMDGDAYLTVGTLTNAIRCGAERGGVHYEQSVTWGNQEDDG
ncbi:MAG: hypothetical protein WD425_07265 [Nitrospirales bacterium]